MANNETEDHSEQISPGPGNEPVFQIEKIYVSDLSLEVPDSPACFMQTLNPNIHLEVNVKNQKIEDRLYDVRLRVVVRAQPENEEQVVFLIELEQCGIFQLDKFPEDEIDVVLGTACPNILLPFARETVADAVTRAGFPPVLLEPMNFDYIYQEHNRRRENARQNAGAEG